MHTFIHKHMHTNKTRTEILQGGALLCRAEPKGARKSWDAEMGVLNTFPVSVIKFSDKSNLKEKGFILAQFEGAAVLGHIAFS